MLRCGVIWYRMMCSTLRDGGTGPKPICVIVARNTRVSFLASGTVTIDVDVDIIDAVNIDVVVVVFVVVVVVVVDTVMIVDIVIVIAVRRMTARGGCCPYVNTSLDLRAISYASPRPSPCTHVGMQHSHFPCPL